MQPVRAGVQAHQIAARRPAIVRSGGRRAGRWLARQLDRRHLSAEHTDCACQISRTKPASELVARYRANRANRAGHHLSSVPVCLVACSAVRRLLHSPVFHAIRGRTKAGWLVGWLGEGGRAGASHPRRDATEAACPLTSPPKGYHGSRATDLERRPVSAGAKAATEAVAAKRKGRAAAS